MRESAALSGPDPKTTPWWPPHYGIDERGDPITDPGEWLLDEDDPAGHPPPAPALLQSAAGWPMEDGSSAPPTLIDIGAEHGSRKVEARFVVGDPSIVAGIPGVRIRTGFLSTHPRWTVTLRREGERASIAIEALATDGTRRAWAYAIPAVDADALLDLRLAPVVDKTRHRIAVGATTWLVDVYGGANDGLAVASPERRMPGEAIQIPDWAVAEITDDDAFADRHLARVPFTRLRRGRTWLVRASEFGQNADLLVQAGTSTEAVDEARLRLGPDAIVLGAAPVVATRAAGRARAKRLRAGRTLPPTEPPR